MFGSIGSAPTLKRLSSEYGKGKPGQWDSSSCPPATILVTAHHQGFCWAQTLHDLWCLSDQSWPKASGRLPPCKTPTPTPWSLHATEGGPEPRPLRGPAGGGTGLRPALGHARGSVPCLEAGHEDVRPDCDRWTLWAARPQHETPLRADCMLLMTTCNPLRQCMHRNCLYALPEPSVKTPSCSNNALCR